MIKIYGIKNCDTVKKALNWLADNNIEYQFHDYKKDGADKEVLEKFVEKFGYEKILNQRGTTWRALSEAEQEKIVDGKSAIKLMVEKPSIIKRPLVEDGEKLLVGFEVGEVKNVGIAVKTI